MTTLRNDIARCAGVGFMEDGVMDWREGCADCLRRTEPGGEYTPHMMPPDVVAFECEYRIAP